MVLQDPVPGSKPAVVCSCCRTWWKCPISVHVDKILKVLPAIDSHVQCEKHKTSHSEVVRKESREHGDSSPNSAEPRSSYGDLDGILSRLRRKYPYANLSFTSPEKQHIQCTDCLTKYHTNIGELSIFDRVDKHLKSTSHHAQVLLKRSRENRKESPNEAEHIPLTEKQTTLLLSALQGFAPNRLGGVQATLETYHDSKIACHICLEFFANILGTLYSQAEPKHGLRHVARHIQVPLLTRDIKNNLQSNGEDIFVELVKDENEKEFVELRCKGCAEWSFSMGKKLVQDGVLAAKEHLDEQQHRAAVPEQRPSSSGSAVDLPATVRSPTPLANSPPAADEEESRPTKRQHTEAAPPILPRLMTSNPGEVPRSGTPDIPDFSFYPGGPNIYKPPPPNFQGQVNSSPAPGSSTVPNPYLGGTEKPQVPPNPANSSPFVTNPSTYDPATWARARLLDDFERANRLNPASSPNNQSPHLTNPPSSLHSSPSHLASLADGMADAIKAESHQRLSQRFPNDRFNAEAGKMRCEDCDKQFASGATLRNLEQHLDSKGHLKKVEWRMRAEGTWEEKGVKRKR